MLKIEEATKELAQKSYAQIQEETAWKWASRAAASFQNSLGAAPMNKVAFILAAEEYYHEAIEHASLVDAGDGSLVEKVKNAVASYAKAAIEDTELSLGINL